jgi:hypothetical protein
MRSSLLFCGTLGILSTLIGCSASVSDEGTDEGATVIEPSGTDSPGKLLVTIPSGPAEATSFTWSNKTEAAGTPIGPVPVGDQEFTLHSAPVTVRARANIKAGQTTTVQAALVAVDAMSGPRTLGLANDPTSWPINVSALEGPSSRGSLGTLARTSTGASGFALLEGSYEVNFGVGGVDGVPVVLAAGDTKKVTLTDTTKRRVARIQAPTRDMPEAACGGLDGKSYRILVSGNSSDYADAAMPDGSELDVGVAPSKGNASYQLHVGAWRDTVPVPLPAAGQGPLTFKLGRADIDDVLINATQPRVPGTYQIYRTDASGSRIAPMLSCEPKTKSGTDLPPGKYRIEVKYKTVEAGDKVDVHMLDVP